MNELFSCAGLASQVLCKVLWYRNSITVKLLEKSPCIMCVQYHGGCSVPWGMFSTMGDIMSTVGDILSTVAGVQHHRGIS